MSSLRPLSLPGLRFSFWRNPSPRAALTQHPVGLLNFFLSSDDVRGIVPLAWAKGAKPQRFKKLRARWPAGSILDEEGQLPTQRREKYARVRR